MRCWASYDGRRWNCALYQNWAVGKWYPVEVLPRLNIAYNQAMNSVHIEGGWLAFQVDVNVFIRKLV